MTRIAVDGVELNVERAGSGPPVVLLHGFTGSAAGWAPLVEVLAPEFTTLAVDIVGHGKSDAPAGLERYQMRRCVDDLASLLRTLGHDRACWLGYSMGGRAALQVAVQRPDIVASLVLEGATPGLRQAAARAERVASDEALAERIERDGVESFVDHWQALPLFATQASLPPETRHAIRAGRLANRAVGLANSLRGMGAGAPACLSPRLDEVRAPVLLLAGASYEKYVALARGMASTIACAQLQIVPGAGQAIHL